MTASKKKTSNSKTAAKKPFDHKEALLSVLNGQYASDYDLTDNEDLSELKECSYRETTEDSRFLIGP